MPEIRKTERYIRMGVRPSDDFIKGSLRTHDIGKIGYSKRIGGKLKHTGKWATQSFLVSVDEPDAMKVRFFTQANALIRRASLGKQLSYAKLKRLM